MTRKIEILLVEDNPQDAELTIRALKEGNLADHLLHLQDGQAALDFLLEESGPERDASDAALPSVVFLDLKLPKVDGIEVLEKLRANAATQSLPIVMFTSSCQECDISEAYRLGVNSYVVKPVDFESYAELVGEIGSYWIRLNRLAR